jgi:uncharacterized protein YpmB
MEPDKKSHGALIGSIIIIVILVIGGIYIWQSKAKQMRLEKEKAALEQQVQPTDIEDLNNLEQDLNTTDPNVDFDVNSLD